MTVRGTILMALLLPIVSFGGWTKDLSIAIQKGIELEKTIDGYTPNSDVLSLGNEFATNTVRVDIFLKGPTKDVDDYDTPYSLERDGCLYSLTNRAEIQSLMNAMSENPYAGQGGDLLERTYRNVNHVYHLILFEDRGKTLLQVRVRVPTGMVTCVIEPRYSDAYSWMNDSIGPWLQARVPLSTNGPCSDVRGPSDTNRTDVGSDSRRVKE